MNKHTQELFVLINEALEEFLKRNPDFYYGEAALNAVAMFSSTIVNGIAKGHSLKEKFKLLDDLLQQEKKWIKYDHEQSN